jgi:signal peptidase II
VRILFVSLFIVLTDQAAKLAIKGFSIPWLGINVHGMGLGASKPIIGDFLKLTYIENPGMAFGIDLGGKTFFSIFSIAASIGILCYLYKAKGERLPQRFALAMILGGAMGNLIDRVFYGLIFEGGNLFSGRVVDFIDVDFFDINFFGYHLSRWPVFNIADASVTIGVLLLVLFYRKREADQPHEIVVPSTNAAKEHRGNPTHNTLSGSEASNPSPPKSDEQPASMK